jgi:putative transposase
VLVSGRAALAGMRGLRAAVLTPPAALLDMIRTDLGESPFVGEGHRPVWARRTIEKKVRVSRQRVLRVMREHGLLSPHRAPRGEPNPHDGTVITEAADVMWATDGAVVETVDEGRVWVFVAVDHFNAECIGFHVCKEGSRFAAL